MAISELAEAGLLVHLPSYSHSYVCSRGVLFGYVFNDSKKYGQSIVAFVWCSGVRLRVIQ